MNIPTFIVCLILAAVVALILYRAYRNKKSGRSSCGCGCSSSCTSSCSSCTSCTSGEQENTAE